MCGCYKCADGQEWHGRDRCLEPCPANSQSRWPHGIPGCYERPEGATALAERDGQVMAFWCPEGSVFREMHTEDEGHTFKCFEDWTDAILTSPSFQPPVTAAAARTDCPNGPTSVHDECGCDHDHGEGGMVCLVAVSHAMPYR